MSIKKRIALAYKVQRVTAMIGDDIKLIKKLNTSLQKLEKTNKDQYILESINTLRALTNIFNTNKLYLIICELIDFKYHATIAFLLEHLNTTETIKLVKKLQILADGDDRY
jgi:hypothetical protein